MKLSSFKISSLLLFVGFQLFLFATPTQAVGLNISIEGPDQVYRGRWPFEIKVVAENPSSVEQAYDLKVVFGGPAWSGSSMHAISGGETYWGEYTRSSASIWWRGTLASLESHDLVYETVSSYAGGTYDFVWVYDAQSGELLASKEITIVQGDFEPSATFSVEGIDDRGKWWHPGEFRFIDLLVLSPAITRVRYGDFESTCGVQGLFTPGLKSNYLLTYWSDSMFAYLPADAPLGKCEITGSVSIYGVELPIQYEFKVKPSN